MKKLFIAAVLASISSPAFAMWCTPLDGFMNFMTMNQYYILITLLVLIGLTFKYGYVELSSSKVELGGKSGETTHYRYYPSYVKHLLAVMFMIVGVTIGNISIGLFVDAPQFQSGCRIYR